MCNQWLHLLPRVAVDGGIEQRAAWQKQVIDPHFYLYEGRSHLPHAFPALIVPANKTGYLVKLIVFEGAVQVRVFSPRIPSCLIVYDVWDLDSGHYYSQLIDLIQPSVSLPGKRTHQVSVFLPGSLKSILSPVNNKTTLLTVIFPWSSQDQWHDCPSLPTWCLI